VGFFGGELKWL